MTQVTTTRTEPTDFENLNPFDVVWRENPYPLYEHVRKMGKVVPIKEGFLLTSHHATATAILKDFELFSSESRAVRRGISLGTAFDSMNDMVITMEPPHHNPLRTLMMQAFTPKRITQLEALTAQITEELLDQAARNGGMDFSKDFAYPLPLRIITHMLGVPREDMELFREWSDALTTAQGRRPSPELLAAANKGITESTAYLREMVKARRVAPKDDVVSAFIAAEQDGEKMTEQQILVNSFLLILAGHESSANLMANGLNAFFAHPDQWRMLCDNPDLSSNSVEEMLRYDPPIQLLTRLVNKDGNYFGQDMQRDQSVVVALAGASRDPEAFDEPETFNIKRKPGPHLALGFGRHFCLGSQLARMEAKVAFKALATRFPDIRATEPPVRLQMEQVRGFSSFPVAMN